MSFSHHRNLRLRTFGLALSALLVCFLPSHLSLNDEDWFDFVRLSCGMFYYDSDGPSWFPILHTDLGSGSLIEGINFNTIIDKGFMLGKVDVWQNLKSRCNPRVYDYAIFISYTLSPNTLIAAEVEDDGGKIKKSYKKRSECEKSRKEEFGINFSYKKSYLCRVIARPPSSF